jgi:hypothetical protein
MALHDHRQFESALTGIDSAILPHLSRLLDSVLESAALARPGIDGEAYAAGLRQTASELVELTALVGAVAQRPTISR